MLGFRTGKSYWMGVIIRAEGRRCQRNPDALIGCSPDSVGSQGLTGLPGQILTWGYKVLLTLAWGKQ